MYGVFIIQIIPHTVYLEVLKMLKLLSLFSGIGAFEKALANIDEPFEVVNYCEIDKYASKAYSLIHNLDENMNLGDITKIDTNTLPNDIDIITYGFPCQDISNAGKGKGFVDESGELTRSGLFFQALRIIEDTKPKIAIAENVKALTGKRFTAEFKIVLDSLEDAGYKNYWAVLNAKDYGIPQNRERVFIVSIRKDIDTGSFHFPEVFPLNIKLKDMLEEQVDEKYFVKTELTRKLVITNEVVEPLALRLVRSDYGKKIRKLYENGELTESWSAMKQLEPRPDGICNTISTLLKDNYILVREATKTGYTETTVGDSVNFEYPNSKTRRGRVGKQVAQTLTTSPQQEVVLNDLQIRYLTPKECFRLMGFEDEDVDILIDNKISNTQLYKMAGNSIVVDVLEEIFVELLNQYENVFPYIERVG